MRTTGISIGNPEFHSTSEVRKYCENGRKLLRPLSNELMIASAELGAALKTIGTGNGAVDSRVQARLVSGHLKRSSRAMNISIAELIRTWMSFEKNFLHSTPSRSKKTFDLHK